MKPLFVYGGGGLGETILEAAEAGGLPEFDIAGWFDDERPHGSTHLGLPVVGGRAEFDALDRGTAVVIAIGNDEVRLSLLRSALKRGLIAPVVRHPATTFFADVELGPGSIVNAGAVIARHVRIGAGGIVNLAATVGHDLHAGDGVQVSPGVNIAGGVTMGEGVFLGPGAVVIQGRTIGEWARVGAGAVVIRDVEPHCTVFGNPARIVERRRPDESS